MSRITLAPNASGTGTLTVAAPNTNTDRTLTLPDVTTTLVGTDATQTLTNKSIAGSQLTGTVASSLLSGALPAIDGSALTGIVTGGMTLLGTLTTTSGSTQTLSGLTLTSYKQLMAVFNNVSSTLSFDFKLDSTTGLALVPGQGNTASIFGFFVTDLTSGVLTANITGVASGSSYTSAGTGPYAGIQNTITTASTSITFAVSSGTFDAGSIRIYGVK
jgi:hypothetical protein